MYHTRFLHFCHFIITAILYLNVHLLQAKNQDEFKAFTGEGFSLRKAKRH